MRLSIIVLFLLPLLCSAQSPSWNGSPGGKYIPSQGTLKTLIIFAQFPDDSLDVDHPEWPKNAAPRLLNTWVDSVESSPPTPGSLTDYFHQMSLGKFTLIGTTRSVIAPRTRQEYKKRGWTRREIHKELIESLDSTMDFAEFDRWDYEGEYNHVERPDGIVDLICIIWRNVADDIPSQYAMNHAFGFIGDEADLGFGDALPVDGGARFIRMSYGGNKTNEPAGSGLTMSKTFTRSPVETLLKVNIHEIGHYLMGGMEYHTGFGCWGMVATFGIRMFVPNAFERHRLGWIDLITLTADSTTLYDVPLPDYVTTGKAVRFVIDSTSGQYFYLENHQGISRWDRKMFTDSIERGIYVLRQDLTTDSGRGPGHQLRLIPADGRHTWTVTRMETNSCCGTISLPVFKQLAADRQNGYHDGDVIPYTEPGTGKQREAPIIIAEGNNGETVLANKTNGDGLDAFRPDYQTVFSPWSNPNSQDKHRNATGFGFEITDTDSTAHGAVYKLTLYSQTAVHAAPAPVEELVTTIATSGRATLTWQASTEPDIASYIVYRTPIDGSRKKVATVKAGKNKIIRWTDPGKIVRTRRPFYTVVAVDRDGNMSLPAFTKIARTGQ